MLCIYKLKPRGTPFEKFLVAYDTPLKCVNACLPDE